MGLLGDIVDKIGDAIDSVGDVVEDVVDGVGDFIGDSVGEIGQIGGGILTGNIGLILAGLGGLIGAEDDVKSGAGSGGIAGQGAVIDLSAIVEQVIDATLGNVFDRITGFTDDIAGDIGDIARQAVNAVRDTARDSLSDALLAQTTAIVTTAETERQLFEDIREFIAASALDLAGLQIATNERIAATHQDSALQLQRISETIQEGTAQNARLLRVSQEAIATEATALLKAQTKGAQSLAGQIEAQTESDAAIAAADREALFRGLEEYVSNPLGRLPEAVGAALTGFFGETAQADVGKLEEGTRRVVLSQLCGDDLTGNLETLLEEFLPDNPILRYVFSVIVAVFSWLQIFGGITSAQAQVVLQQYGKDCPYVPLSPPDAILAHFRGQISRNEMFETIQKSGYSQPDAQSMWISSLNIPNELDLLGMLFRGEIQESEFKDAMAHRGWDATWTKRVQDTGWILPPVQDLISMAVREAFTPSAVKEFGLDQDFPEEFAFWAEKQGVSRDWAERYWAAHWGLPSVQMGYEMLHRGIIKEEQLKALMKALDIVPAWRDNLIRMSYANYTRVDIRRMNKLGILSEAEVFAAYQHIGYDEEKARNLTRFTLELNQDDPADQPEELRGITRSNTLNFYSDGIITREDARFLLIASGHSEIASDLLLDSVDLELEREERKAERELIIERAKAGDLSFEDAEDALASLGLETTERAKAMNQLRRAFTAKTRLPSKADLAKFLSAGIIDNNGFLDGMNRLGYSGAWSRRYLQLVSAADA